MDQKTGKIKRNTIITQEEIEVYQNKMWLLVDEYIDGLLEKDDIKNRLCFSGLLRFIYRHLFKPTINDIIYNRRNSIINYSDINALYSVYNMYLDLCAKYKMEYTETGFTTFSGIDLQTINDWKNGKNIPAINGLSTSLWSVFAKKISANSEQSLSESMLNGNTMSLAYLKCKYSWIESSNIQVTSNNSANNNIVPLTEIANNHNIKIPEKPNLD